MPGEMRARVRAAGQPGLSLAAPLAVDACGSGLVVATLLLLELSGGATGLLKALRAQGTAPRTHAAPSRLADAKAFGQSRRRRRSCPEHDVQVGPRL